MAQVIGFISIKGGVGKTTLALETAASLANNFKKRVLVIDANFSAPNLGLWLGIKPEYTLHDVLAGDAGPGFANAIHQRYNFHIVPAAMEYKKDVDPFRLKKIIAKVRNRYDFIILDSSPNYHELIPVVTAADKLYVVTTPDHVTLGTTLKAIRLAQNKKTPIAGIIINRARNPKFEYSVRDIEERAELPVLARIRDSKDMAKSLFFQVPLSIEDKGHHISQEIQNFASAICGAPEKSRGIFSRLFSFGNWSGKEKINRELIRREQ